MVVAGVAEAAVAEVVVALVFVAETAITGMAAAVGGGLAGLTVRVVAVGEVVISTQVVLVEYQLKRLLRVR